MITIMAFILGAIACIFGLMVGINSLRWAKVVFLRNYRLLLRSRYYGLAMDVVYEGGKTLLATALIGGLFVPDDKVTLKTLLMLIFFGTISYMYGYLKKERKRGK
ncbi:MAG: hypothetical protein PHE67_00545 [Campylobacterales bacterium]|nr:hypothetical protein [Campylobacterales bacterium]